MIDLTQNCSNGSLPRFLSASCRKSWANAQTLFSFLRRMKIQGVSVHLITTTVGPKEDHIPSSQRVQVHQNGIRARRPRLLRTLGPKSLIKIYLDLPSEMGSCVSTLWCECSGCDDDAEVPRHIGRTKKMHLRLGNRGMQEHGAILN